MGKVNWTNLVCRLGTGLLLLQHIKADINGIIQAGMNGQIQIGILQGHQEVQKETASPFSAEHEHKFQDSTEIETWNVSPLTNTRTILQVSDPCKTALELPSLYRRISGNNLGPSDTPLCDKFLDEGWYSVRNFYVATSPPASCGTKYIWWMDDTKAGPSEVGQELEKRLCLKIDSKLCEYTKKIKMINCGDNFVYYLSATDGCPEAYCLDMDGPKPTGTAPTVSLRPVIEVEREIESVGNKLHFYCKFEPHEDRSLWYTVEWYVGYNTLGSRLYESSPTQYFNWDDFKMKTALKEDKMPKIGIYLRCSVRARRTEFGFPSEGFSSDAFFAGIEVLNNTIIHLSDTISPQIFIRSTIPFACDVGDTACAMYVDIVVPDYEDSIPPDSRCRILEAGTKANTPCGVKIPKTQWDKPFPLNIALKTGKTSSKIRPIVMEIHFKTVKLFHSHSIFADQILPQNVKVHISPNMEILKGKSCHAICDPHMKTFDDLKYENQREGTFVMYKNTDFEAEVQLKTKACNRNNQTPYCPCGVAVRAGVDLFIVDKCDNVHVIRMQQCLDGVLDGKIMEDGNSYIVHLPTGTTVTIMKEQYSAHILDVFIYPSLADERRTTGLCGYFDGFKTNDLRKRNGDVYSPEIKSDWDDPQGFNDEWGVRISEDLFKPSNHATLREWREELYICSCGRKKGLEDIETTATCSPDLQKICERDKEKPAEAGKCGLFRKRSTDDSKEEYATYDVDAFEIQDIPLKISQRSANITNSMEWAGTHLESAKSNCIFQVYLNQPIPEDVLQTLGNFTSSNNSSEGTYNRTSLETTSLPSSNAFIYSDTFLKELESISCPIDCDSHGVCRNGTCECFTGFGDVDCSVDLSRPPVMSGIPDLGVCDLRQRPCQKTSVLGQNFIDVLTLSCRLSDFREEHILKRVKNVEPLAYIYVNNVKTPSTMSQNEPQTTKIQSNGTKQTHNNTTQVAKRISSVEVECALPDNRGTRETGSPVGDSTYLARGYRISVSNNGELFSQESTLLIFDSECVNCTKAGFDIHCVMQDGFCLMDGKCYKELESSGCQLCSASIGGLYSWINGPECQDQDTSVTSQESTLWIIGAVLGPVGLIFLLVAVVISVKKFTRIKKVAASQEWTACTIKS